MYQPAGTGQVLWRRSNIEVAGIMVAGNCILCLVVTGFGFLLMGTFTMAASTAFEWKPSDPELFRNQPNVPRLIGTIFLSIGGIITFVGLILLFIIIRKARRESQNRQTQMTVGTTYPGSNYASTQSYPATGQARSYPTQPNAQSQPYPSNAGQGQPYPPVSGQGQPYPPVAGQGQGFPTVSGSHPYQPGQVYPPASGQGQPYPPVAAGQGQPYPPVPGQGQYPSTGGQQYPPAGGIPEKSTDLTNLPYNPGHPYHPPPSGYPGSGHPPPDAPPPYSDIR